jgi:hypothetical protein
MGERVGELKWVTQLGDASGWIDTLMANSNPNKLVIMSSRLPARLF